MNFLQRWVLRWLRPLIEELMPKPYYDAVLTLRLHEVEEAAGRNYLAIRQADIDIRKSDLQLRKDIHAELKRVGAAIGELQSRAVFTTTTPDNLASLGERLDILEKVLVAATEPKKPGNHIGPDHEFGNRVRL